MGVLGPFAAAAAILDGGRSDDGRNAEALGLLASLGWSTDRVEGGRRLELSRAFALAARFDRIFSLGLPDAAAVALTGGTIDPRGFGLAAPPRDVSGKSFDAGDAFLGAIGEAVEYLSLQRWGDEPTRWLSPSEVAYDEPSGAIGSPVECLPAWALGSGRTSWLPAERCIRDVGVPAVWTRSGYGAGATLSDAVRAAVLELVERDAVALWWLGGRPAATVPLEIASGEDAGHLADVLRSRTRRSSLLDVTTDVGVPTVVAFSTDREGGDFAFGAASRLTYGDAAASAFAELAQMEFAVRLAREKRDQVGEGGLGEVEQGHLRRSCLRAGGDRRFQAGPAEPPSIGDGDITLEILAERMPGECWLVDLTRPELGIPCVRAFAPGLQTYPVAYETPRLRACAERHGAGRPLSEVALM